MGKDRSIKAQLEYALAQSQHLGESKRSYKMGHGGQTGERVYSNGYSDSLFKVARSFGLWMKEYHPDVRQAKDVKQEHLQHYLDCHIDRWGQDTYGKVISNLAKLENVVKKKFYRKTDWGAHRLRNPVEVSHSNRKLVAVTKDYTSLMKVMHPSYSNSRSNAWKMLPLSRYAGMRIQETSKVHFGRLTTTGGRWGYGTLILHGKEDGTKTGRWRTVDIVSPEAQKALSEAFEGVAPGSPVIEHYRIPGKPIDKESINRALHRSLRKTGLDPEKWKWNGAHPFRKAFAQECYDLLRSTGVKKTVAADYAHDQLGHGEDRRGLDPTYIQNKW